MSHAWTIDVCRICGRQAKWPFCEHRDKWPQDGSWCVSVVVVPKPSYAKMLDKEMADRAEQLGGE